MCGWGEGFGVCAPTKALANRVKPIASGAQFPWPGLATAAAYTTDTSVKVMIICRTQQRRSRYGAHDCHDTGLHRNPTRQSIQNTKQHTSQPNSWLLVTAGSCVGVKHPGPPSPCPTRTPGMIIACQRTRPKPSSTEFHSVSERSCFTQGGSATAGLRHQAQART